MCTPHESSGCVESTLPFSEKSVPVVLMQLLLSYGYFSGQGHWLLLDLWKTLPSLTQEAETLLMNQSFTTSLSQWLSGVSDLFSSLVITSPPHPQVLIWP